MEWDEYIHRETPSVPIREPQKVTLYAVKSFYVRLDGEKVRVEGYSFNIPSEFVYTAGYLGDPSIPVLMRNNVILDIYLLRVQRGETRHQRGNSHRHTKRAGDSFLSRGWHSGAVSVAERTGVNLT